MGFFLHLRQRRLFCVYKFNHSALTQKLEVLFRVVQNHHISNFQLSDSVSTVGIFEQSIGARNQVGIGFSYRPARLYRLAESILGIDCWPP
jgi:hypothetical protein